MTFGGKINKLRNQMSLIACLIACILLSACSNDMEKIKFFDRKTLPDQIISNAHIDYSEYGHLKIHLNAPRIEQFSGVNAQTIYPKGVDLRFHDTMNAVRAYVRANYGISYDAQNLIKIKDSVVIIDYQSGDTSYLHDLTWDQELKQISSNNPVRSVNGKRVTYGDGFKSDENFENPIIVHQRSTIELKDEEVTNEQ